jgi:hypothetical protein
LLYDKENVSDTVGPHPVVKFDGDHGGLKEHQDETTIHRQITMARTRSQARTQESTPRPTIRIPDDESSTTVRVLEGLRTHAHRWLAELQQDIDPATGYLFQDPTTLYGARVHELVHYICSQSSEVKTIQNSRALRTSAPSLYATRLVRRLGDTAVPLAVALYVAISYYSSIRQSLDQEGKAPPGSWSALTVGDWVGETLRTVVSTPSTFLAATLNGALHIHQNTEYVVYTPLLFVGAYWLTLLLVRFLLNLHTLFSTEHTLWAYQELILQEMYQVVERAVTGILRPALVARYKDLIANPRTSYTNYSMLHAALLEPLLNGIKARPLPDLFRIGNGSSDYTDSLHLLIQRVEPGLPKIEDDAAAANRRQPLKPSIQ